MSEKKKTAKKKQCKCVELANKTLGEHNASIVQSHMINLKTGKTSLGNPQIVVEKIDSKKRKRLPTFFCTYCPMCGEKFSSPGSLGKELPR